MVAVLLAAGEIGYQLGSARVDAPDSLRSLMSGTGAATLGLLGLLLGFALSMAIARWDIRRDVIVDESNAIGTLSLRAGLLEDPLRDELHEALIRSVALMEHRDVFLVRSAFERAVPRSDAGTRTEAVVSGELRELEFRYIVPGPEGIRWGCTRQNRHLRQ